MSPAWGKNWNEFREERSPLERKRMLMEGKWPR